MTSTPRILVIRHLSLDANLTYATKTWLREIPTQEFDAICRWIQHGGPLWGRERQRVTINILRRE